MNCWCQKIVNKTDSWTALTFFPLTRQYRTSWIADAKKLSTKQKDRTALPFFHWQGNIYKIYWRCSMLNKCLATSMEWFLQDFSTLHVSDKAFILVTFLLVIISNKLHHLITTKLFFTDVVACICTWRNYQSCCR